MEKCIHTKNGIPIYSYENKMIASFSLSLFLRAGSMYESEEENGSAHLFEHMVFRHLNRLYSGQLYKKLDSLGLSFDGSTYCNYVEFNLTGAAEHFADATEILADIFLPFQLTGNDLKPEKDRIKAEIYEAGDSSSLSAFTDKILWSGTSLAGRVPGTPSTVNRIGITRLKEIQKKLLACENIFVYAAGSFDTSKLTDLAVLLEKRGIYHAPRRGRCAPVPADFGKRPRTVHLKGSDYTYVRICFDCPAGARDLPAIFLLGDILFGGNSSVIHDALSEQSGLIYSFYSYVDIYENISELYLSYEVRSDRLYRSIQEAFTTFRQVGDCAEEYIKYALPEYVDNARILEDSPSDLTSKFAYETHIVGQNYKSAEERKAAFLAVTPQKIRELAYSIFRPENLTLAVKASKKKTDTDSLRSLIDILETSTEQDRSVKDNAR
ncbi:MAG: insulinase family protein [Clostridia bacterium]|nr:insulinase family protein [Clostridia bacterium]